MITVCVCDLKKKKKNISTKENKLYNLLKIKTTTIEFILKTQTQFEGQ